MTTAKPRFRSCLRLPVYLAGLASLLLVGCANYSGAGDSLDRAADARQLAQREGRNDFDCPAAQADNPLPPVREDDWQDGLFSSYIVPVSGCGRQGNYRIVCREGYACSVAE